MVGKAPDGERGDLRALLRHWRAARGKSQLELALAAGVSQRHLSFIESARSRPSRETLLAIAEALDVPLRERNSLLLAAGYAPAYAEPSWNATEMRGITAAVDRLLRQQEPYPAVLTDRSWNVLAANAASARFFGHFVDLDELATLTGRRNLLHMIFHPAGLRRFVHDWDRVSASLIRRIHRESVERVPGDATRALLAEVSAYPGVVTDLRPDVAGAGDELPMIPLGFDRDGAVLNYFSMVATVGAPRTVAAEELRVECLFPADASTEQRHLAIMAGETVIAAVHGSAAD